MSSRSIIGKFYLFSGIIPNFLFLILIYGILIPVLFNGMKQNKKINIIIFTIIIIFLVIYKLYIEASKDLKVKDEKMIC